MKCNMLVIVFALFLFKEDAFAHNRAKREYSQTTYDLSGSAITQNFRFTRDLSSASDEGTHTCSIWGNKAVKTYTNEFYHFQSTCNHILSRQCQGGTEDFNVEIRSDPNGKLEHIFIKTDGVMIVVTNDTYKVNDVKVLLPYENKVITIQQYGVNVRIKNRQHTISVVWNHEDALSITVDSQYKGLLCGLCGPFDDSISTTYDLNYIYEYKLDAWNADCTTHFSKINSCASADSCSAIRKFFAACSSPAINDKFVEMCQKDVCTNNEAVKSLCSAFNEASKGCELVDASNWNTWKDSVQCTWPTCPGNQVYKDCGPVCMSTCTDPNSEQWCDQCVNTCDCPQGTVLDNVRGDNTCINYTDCPCEYNGQIYNSGETHNSLCHSCTCKSGIWECTDLNCPKICQIEEGTHITTFDGKYFNLIGDCSYYAIVTTDWSVKIEMHPCHSAYRQTCLQRVTFTKFQNSYSINKEGTIHQNDNQVGLPFGNGEIMIFQQSSLYIQLITKDGLKIQVLISPIMQLYMSLPKTAKGTTKGLCGTYNDNVEDDFLSSQGIVEYIYVPFSESWKTNDECPSPIVNPTCVSSEHENYAKEQCAYIKDPTGAFSNCHSAVEYLVYYEMCKAASCNCIKLDDCVCAAMEAYVHACSVKGIVVMNWRRSVCAITCPSTQVYHYNMRACNRTCEFLSKFDFTCQFQDTPVDGCGCPEGTYMDDKATCVQISECPCYVNGIIAYRGEIITSNGMNCVCQNGVPSCLDENSLPISEDCQDKQFSDCTNTSLCKRTCETLNKPCPNPCVPGCVCPDGLVQDSTGGCIEPSRCPCLFGSETFGGGETITIDCNTCTCNGGEWECTDNSCPKTCTVYGDGHYITFDGKRYKFDGNCEYIFLEDKCRREIGTFQILTQSVPCCENGVTCSREIRILIGKRELTLSSATGVREVSSEYSQCTDNSYTIHTVGLYLILSFSNGITLVWDKRTRLSITLDPKWKNKVCGLCGNFNDDLEDDLTSKGNTLLTNTLEFGNCWKSTQLCSDTVNEIYPCDNNPYCLSWAQKRCNLIHSAIFQACHKKVDPIPFYDACIQEACACDMEGKYLGFCTAVAVYAEACNKAEVCIRWRTPELCPVYCDYYNAPNECSWHYQPCGTITTRTCTGHFIGKKYSAILEGCYAKCPESAPYLDENTMKCVALPQCTCYYEGRILQPDETTRNGCEECMCQDGITTCQRTTTTTATTTVTTPSTTTISSTTITETTPTTETTTSITSGTTPTTSSTTGTTESTTTETTPTTSSTETTTSTTSGTTPTTYSTTGTTESTTSSTTETPTTLTTGTTTSTTTETTPTTETTTSITSGTTPTTSSTTGTTESTTTETTPTTSSTETTTSTTSETTSTSTTGTTTITTSGTTPTTYSTTGTTESTTSSTTETPTTLTTGTTTSTTTETTPTTSSTETTTSTTSETTPTSTTGTTISTTSETTPTTSSTTGTTESTTSSTTETTTTLTTGTTTSTTTETTPTTSSTETTTSTTSETPTSTTGTTPSTTSATTPTTSSTTGTTESTTSSTTETTTSTSGTTTTSETTPTTETTTSTTSETTPTSTTGTTTSTTSGTTPTTSSTTGTTESTTTETTTETSTSTTSETTPTTATTVTTEPTVSSTTEAHCPGVWSSWYNNNTPSAQSPNDNELLAPIREIICSYPSDKISNIQCQLANDTYWPPSLSPDVVVCEKDIGLTCTVSKDAVGQICNDYEIRVCCEQTEVTTMTTTVPTTTPPEECYCDSNPPRKCNETWVENCATFTCVYEETYKIDHVSCKLTPKPQCYSGLKPTRVKTEDGCCSEWDCQSVCYVWGRKHYRTFDGVFYKFHEDCSYILVEEIIPTYNFSVILDNHNCPPSAYKSCEKSIIIIYNGTTIHVSPKKNDVKINGESINLPVYSEEFTITKCFSRIRVQIPSIRTVITATRKHFRIKLSEMFFKDKLQGQCGSVSKRKTDDCMRKNGKIEPTDCCSETAHEWKTSYTNKKHCTDLPTYQPCSPPTPPPPCEYETPMCNAIFGNSFKSCRALNSLSEYFEACRDDNCWNATNEECSSLEAAAYRCNGLGLCVDWRQSTYGSCSYTCPHGFMYKPCATNNHNYCTDNLMRTGEVFTEPTEGCYCPEGLMLSEDETQCVPSCSRCTDYSGNVKNDGEEWSDQNNTCIYYRCSGGTVIETELSCFYNSTCDEVDKKWDDRHCCYYCPQRVTLCKVHPESLTIIKDNCTATVELNSCQGNCNSFSIFDYTIDKMKHNCECCEEQTTETKEVTLACGNGSSKQYSYISAKTCQCSICESSTP
ncbi:mucin-2-like isoform X6 [Leucoraja erinacea]|uniref:mucin-2-like isoform X6 n=1 Tax=Leucoraja erinaceus TaxID=7782 RepID=UPI0024559971|nr:mucin-2-like isoform X6 [Leucoraja erinacea]